eukprot:364513-Chlamydomonas_euryale.AAC.1
MTALKPAAAITASPALAAVTLAATLTAVTAVAAVAANTALKPTTSVIAGTAGLKRAEHGTTHAQPVGIMPTPL